MNEWRVVQWCECHCNSLKRQLLTIPGISIYCLNISPISRVWDYKKVEQTRVYKLRWQFSHKLLSVDKKYPHCLHWHWHLQFACACKLNLTPVTFFIHTNEVSLNKCSARLSVQQNCLSLGTKTGSDVTGFKKVMKHSVCQLHGLQQKAKQVFAKAAASVTDGKDKGNLVARSIELQIGRYDLAHSQFPVHSKG